MSLNLSSMLSSSLSSSSSSPSEPMPGSPNTVPAVTGLSATAGLMTIRLDWQPLDWSTVLDHYRVIGTAQDGTAQLLGKTIFPTFLHDRLAPRGETWSYHVEVVDAAGAVSPASATVTATSTRSVTTGRPLAALGQFDWKTVEFRFAPADYAQIPETYPSRHFTAGNGATAADVPYLLPGPGDAWAGNDVYSLSWEVNIPAGDGPEALALWLVDTTRLGGILDVRIGSFTTELNLPQGGTAGSRQGDANQPGSPLEPVAFEVNLPAGTLQPGANTVELTLSEGGWVAWDALGLFRGVPAES